VLWDKVINPKRDLPIGLLGSLGVVTALYMAMAATIVLMVPYTDISPEASFAAAFEARDRLLSYHVNHLLTFRSLPEQRHASVRHVEPLALKHSQRDTFICAAGYHEPGMGTAIALQCA
jgi:hypothetical protein